MTSGPEMMKNWGGEESQEDMEALLRALDDSEEEKKAAEEKEKFLGPLSEADIEQLAAATEGREKLTEKKKITPEVLAKVWAGFNKAEKQMVYMDDNVFERNLGSWAEVMKKYGKNETEIETRLGVIKSVRKLVKNHDPLAALIGPENV